VWQATTAAAAIIVVLKPLDLDDPGFLMTFGATIALVEGARRGAALVPTRAVFSWIVATIIGSLAVEAALLPVSASAFSRVTSAGLMLNLLAVPAMGVVQIAAMTVTLVSENPLLAYHAGWTTHIAANALVSSADLVKAAPWLASRVPPPSAWLVLVYYGALLMTVAGRGRLRIASAVLYLVALVAVISGADVTWLGRDGGPSLRLTVFDVGQAESMLLETSGHTLLIDTGGAPFGGGIDVGRRVLAPALWTRGVRSLDALLVTHSDPDHLGGAVAVVDDFRPRQIWEGIRVPRHLPTQELTHDAARLRIPIAALRAGETMRLARSNCVSSIRRHRIGSDDGFAMTIRWSSKSSTVTSRCFSPGTSVPRLSAQSCLSSLRRAFVSSKWRITAAARPRLWRSLKAGGHGLRVISCGRGNRFGHPTPDVLQRLESIGATVLRTDRDGQITIQTDGHSLRVATYIEDKTLTSDEGPEGHEHRDQGLFFLTLCHSASISSSVDSFSRFPRAANSRSMVSKRLVNLSVARRSAASGSMPSLRDRLAMANSRSPISSSARDRFPVAPDSTSRRSSSTSSSILSSTSSGCVQSNPTAAARKLTS
jgi:competence protein ComEC